jgi:hypothetical protein
MIHYLEVAANEPGLIGDPTPEKIAMLFEHLCAANHPFVQQASFMLACGQNVDHRDWTQARLYNDLIEEEYKELRLELSDLSSPDFSERTKLDKVAKEGVDLIYVVLGLLHSLGIDSVLAFDLVQRSNAAKVNPDTGMVSRRADGKILKPLDWEAPDMSTAV